MLCWAYSLLLVVLMASPAWAGYDEGLAAYKQGNYAVALREFRPLAEQGVKPAQFMLGNMHLSGGEVVKAASWPEIALCGALRRFPGPGR